MQPPVLLLSNPPVLSERLKQRTNELLSRIVGANQNTQFARTASDLAEFRYAMTGLVEAMDDEVLSETFRKTVPFTDYDSYAPFIARFFEKPCKASAVVDLLAPGLPECITESSSTSGSLPKAFPKYNCLPGTGSLNNRTWTVPAQRRRTKAWVCYFRYNQIDVEDEDNGFAAKIYTTCGSVLVHWQVSSLDPARDEEMMATFMLDHAAPYAAGFITKWRSFLLIHALFAVGSRSLETMRLVFINALVDMICQLDMEFDMMVDCIANGTIPDLDGIANVRHHLESNISPDPERAAELRRIGRPSSRPGWCGVVWPNLRSVSAGAGGSFASAVPLAQWFLGHNVEILSRGYGSTESWIGGPYNPRELNQFKPDGKIFIEFLDISKSDSTDALTQLWEIELERRYEVVLTTKDGLWRYRLGDVVEVSGFDPTDGVPIIRFIERRNVVIRFPEIMITEEQLRAAMSSVFSDILAKVVDWTATIDDQFVPATIGFFVELSGDQGRLPPASELSLAPRRMLDELLRLNGNAISALARGSFRKPTIRIVQPGTFSDFRQLKLDEGSKNLGQIKVPVVLPKAAYVTWFLERVAQEL